MACFRLVLLAWCLSVSFTLQAAPITFFGQDLNGNPLSRIPFPLASAARNMFLAQLPGSSTNSLEALAPNTLVPVAISFSGSLSATLSGGNSAVRSLAADTDGFGEFPTSGTKYVSVDAGSGLTVTFSSPVTSFGFYGTDFGDFSGTNHLMLIFTGPGGSVTQAVNNTLGTGRGSTADGSVLFFGYINATSAFTNVQISSTNDSFGFDDPVTGVPGAAPVPEPGSLLLLAAGLLAISLQTVNKLKNSSSIIPSGGFPNS